MTLPELPGNGHEGPEPLPSAAPLRNPLGRRASDALVDVVQLSVVFLILGLATGGTPARTLPPGELNVSAGAWAGLWWIRFGEATVAGWWLALYLAATLVYYFAPEATTGRTVGKRILGLRVVSRDGTRPSPGAIAARKLLRLVGSVPLLYLVGFITADVIVVEAYAAPGRVTAGNLSVVTLAITAGLRRLASQDGGALQAGPRTTTLRGLPALDFQVSGRSYSGTPITSTPVLAFAGTTQYEINCQHTRAHAAQVAPACAQVLRTFTVAGSP